MICWKILLKKYNKFKKLLINQEKKIQVLKGQLLQLIIKLKYRINLKKNYL